MWDGKTAGGGVGDDIGDNKRKNSVYGMMSMGQGSWEGWEVWSSGASSSLED